jgi:nucleotide-binding universal stress UspA family protein
MDFKRILVAINGTKIDDEVVQLACELARPSKGKVYVTYVIQLDRTLPLDAEVEPAVEKAERALSAAEHCAADYKYKVSTDLLQARAVGPALVNEAAERSADLIILGMSYKTRFGEFSLGDIAPHVLKHALCYVMILREPFSSTE